MKQPGKKIFGTLLASIIAFSGASISAETASGLLTITFDDGGTTQYQNGLRISKAYDIVGTIFVPPAMISEASEPRGPDWIMNWNEVREFHDAGWEIGAHGMSHLRLTELDSAEIDREVEQPIADIEEQIGVEPVSFSSPYGDFNGRTIKRIMESYSYHLSWKGHEGRNPVTAIDQRYIGRLEVTSDMSSALVCGEMVRAAQTGIWLVLLFHGIVEENPQEYQITAGKFEEILSCADLLKQNGIIRVATARDAMEIIGAID